MILLISSARDGEKNKNLAWKKHHTRFLNECNKLDFTLDFVVILMINVRR